MEKKQRGGKRLNAGRKPLNKDTKVLSIRVESKHHDDLKKLNLMIRSALQTNCGTARDLKFIRARKFSDELAIKYGVDFAQKKREDECGEYYFIEDGKWISTRTCKDCGKRI